MRYFSALLRIVLLLIGIRIIYLNNFDFGTIYTCIGMGFIIIALYFAVIAKFGVEAIFCPMYKGKNYKIKK